MTSELEEELKRQMETELEDADYTTSIFIDETSEELWERLSNARDLLKPDFTQDVKVIEKVRSSDSNKIRSTPSGFFVQKVDGKTYLFKWKDKHRNDLMLSEVERARTATMREDSEAEMKAIVDQFWEEEEKRTATMHRYKTVLLPDDSFLGRIFKWFNH